MLLVSISRALLLVGGATLLLVLPVHHSLVHHLALLLVDRPAPLLAAGVEHCSTLGIEGDNIATGLLQNQEGNHHQSMLNDNAHINLGFELFKAFQTSIELCLMKSINKKAEVLCST